MSRDNFDIPEVFRRAMEEAGWDTGRGGDGDDEGGGGDRPPFPRRSEPAPGANRLRWLLAIFFLLFLSVNFLVSTYTEWLWFTEVGYTSVWLKQWLFRFGSFAVGFLVALVVLWGNWHFARRRAIQTTPPFYPQVLKSRFIGGVLVAAALFLSLGFAGALSSQWESLLQFVNKVPFGTSDPLFNRDIGFYLFELPVYELIQGWFVSLLVFVLLGVGVLYALNFVPDIQRGRWQPWQNGALRQHVAALGAVLLALWAVGYWFDAFDLLYSPRGVVFGASYTDINASLLALRLQMVTMAIAAVLMILNVFRFSLRPLLVIGGVWLLVTIGVGNLYPGLLQRYSVEPNELARESEYIAYNIEYTRQAFGLDNVDERPFTFEQLSQETLASNESLLKNIRIWDYRPLLTTYGQLQALTLYYQFTDIDIDRYVVNGETRQVMLAARELDKANLPNSSWVNRKLEFTHGYGIVMNPVDRVTPEGQPDFFIEDLPPQSTVDIEVTRPEIYYGETTYDAVFVGSDRDEFSYPGDSAPVYSSYAGTGGVPIDNYLKRVLFAIRFGDANVLLSDEINNNTRIQYHRQIQERVRQITPFLTLDNDPYVVVVDGRLFWIQDAYTTSRLYPYSEPIAGINYIRNSVKIVIDAYNGTVTYYLADETDPIIQTYSRAFPGLFQPFADMPEGLQAHIRYPEGLFRIQSDQYLSYHMTDVRVFYNQEDRWEIPTEVFQGGEQPLEPYYVLLRLPGEAQPEYLLIQPFTPRERDNMVGWMAARNDPANYGELVVYRLPRQELVFGPSQIESRIDQDPEISQQFSLWDQSGSSVIRGNLLAIPLDNSFLYVEPVYLQATASALPELRRVIVASDTRIAMEQTLEEALAALLEARPSTVVEGGNEEPAAEDTAVTPSTTIPVDATVEELIKEANDHFVAAEAAQQRGDWAAYGEALNALEETLNQLMALTGQ